MGEISYRLTKAPSAPLESNDDSKIKELIVDLGISGRFTNVKIGKQKPLIQTAMVGEHPTHFILIARWLGYDETKENGYRAWCFPKSEIDQSSFLGICKEILGDRPILEIDTSFTQDTNLTN